MAKTSERYEAKEADQRLRKILKGAFAGPPTPLKDIPKRNGQARTGARKASPRTAIKGKR